MPVVSILLLYEDFDFGYFIWCWRKIIPGLLMGNCSLRMIKSSGGIGEEWTQEPLAAQAARCIRTLYGISLNLLSYMEEFFRHFYAVKNKASTLNAACINPWVLIQKFLAGNLCYT